MRTRCSIKDCPSREIGRECRNKLDVPASHRLFTLFSVPKKDLELRDKWSKIMKCDFKDRDVLCEFHFSEDAINRDHVIQLPDGVHKIPLARISLKPGAVPDNKKIILQPIFDQVEEKLTPNNIFMANLNKICNKDYKNKENLCSQVSFYNDHMYAQREPEPIAGNFNSVDRNARIDCPKKPVDERILPEILTSEMEIETFNPSFDDFIKETLPSLWRWTKINDDVLIAAIYDPISFIQNKSLVITKNLMEHKLDVQAIIDGHPVNVPELEAVETVQGIINNVNILHTLLVCNGISKTKERSKNCMRYVRPKSHCNVYGRARCKSCEILRKKSMRDQAVSDKRNEKLRQMKQAVKKLEMEKLKLQGTINKLEAKMNYYSKQVNLQDNI